MSGRRHRIAARPNVARGPRATESKKDNNDSNVKSDLPKTRSTSPRKDPTPKPSASLSQNEDRGGSESTEVPSENAPISKPIQVTEQPTTSNNDATPSPSLAEAPADNSAETSSVADVENEAAKTKASSGPTRRSRIQARPSLTRKPRNAAKAEKSTPNSSTSDDTVNKDQLQGSSKKNEEAKPAEPTVPTITVEQAAAETPALGDDNENEDAEDNDTKSITGRNFKPKAKPNVLEAGRARMRRLSESLELSPYHPSPSRRTRHASTSSTQSGTVSAAAQETQSSVRVAPLDRPATEGTEEQAYKTEASAGANTEGDTDKTTEVISSGAKKRPYITSSGSKDSDEESHVDNAELSELQSEMPPPPAPVYKKKRKVRKVIKSDEPPDPTTMTIKELIYYQPTSNPLPQKENAPKKPGKRKRTNTETSSVAGDEDAQSVCGDNAENNDDVIAQSPAPTEREKTPEKEQDMAPQIMIGEDGQIIINEQSLTVQAAKPDENVVYEDVTYDQSEESATYASFRKNARPLRFWSDVETDQFYKALACIGTDFTLMCQLFPNRNRTDIKRKFKREEKYNPGKIQAAMTGNLNFEQEPFPEYNAAEERAKERTKAKEEAKQAKEEAKKKEKADKALVKSQGLMIRGYSKSSACQSKESRHDMHKTNHRRRVLGANTRGKKSGQDRSLVASLGAQQESEAEKTVRNVIEHGLSPFLTQDVLGPKKGSAEIVPVSSALPKLALPSAAPSVPLIACIPVNIHPRPQEHPAPAGADSERGPSEKTAPIRPVPLLPGVTTMLHQNQSLNQQISDMMLARNRCSTAPPPGVMRSPPPPPAQVPVGTPQHPARPASTPGISMSPLYNLDGGDCIMVRTEQIGASRKVHHLYLYSPSRGEGSATLTDISSLNSLMSAQNQKRLEAGNPASQPRMPSTCDPTLLAQMEGALSHTVQAVVPLEVKKGAKPRGRPKSKPATSVGDPLDAEKKVKPARKSKAKPKPNTARRSAISQTAASQDMTSQSDVSHDVTSQSAPSTSQTMTSEGALDLTMTSSAAGTFTADGSQDLTLPSSPSCSSAIGSALNAITQQPTPQKAARTLTPSPYRPKPFLPSMQHEHSPSIVETIPRFVPTTKISDISTAQAVEDVCEDTAASDDTIDVTSEASRTFTNL